MSKEGLNTVINLVADTDGQDMPEVLAEEDEGLGVGRLPVVVEYGDGQRQVHDRESIADPHTTSHILDAKPHQEHEGRDQRRARVVDPETAAVCGYGTDEGSVERDRVMARERKENLDNHGCEGGRLLLFQQSQCRGRLEAE